jgi:ribose-phosphate pyrophosphokinase
MAEDLLLLSGSAHLKLSKSISDRLSIELVNAVIGLFPDGETDIEITDNVRGQDVFVIQPTGYPADHNIIELLLIIDALHRSSAARITAVIPYFGYARQDRKEASRKPISARLVANIISAAGADRILSVDLHAAQIQGFTDLPFDHLSAAGTIAEKLAKKIDHPVIVAPDIGASKMAKNYAKRFGTDWAIVDKDRIDGRTTKVTAIIGEHKIKGRNALIVDDMVSTATSLLNAAQALKEQGALQVMAVATHGVLCDGATERITQCPYLDRLYVTDSLPVTASKKIELISIAPLLAKAIRNIHEGKSLSGLF